MPAACFTGFTFWNRAGSWRMTTRPGWKSKNDENGPYLWDGLTDISKWVGCYLEGRLIACLRALSYPNFDLSKYVSVPPYLNHRRSIEYNRLAVHADFRGCRHITLLLIRFFAETNWPRDTPCFHHRRRACAGRTLQETGVPQSGCSPVSLQP